MAEKPVGMIESQRGEQEKARLRRIHEGTRALVAAETDTGQSRNDRSTSMSSEQMEAEFERLVQGYEEQQNTIVMKMDHRISTDGVKHHRRG